MTDGPSYCAKEKEFEEHQRKQKELEVIVKAIDEIKWTLANIVQKAIEKSRNKTK